MSLSKMTLIGMNNYDPDLFKDAFFPDGIDKDLVINALLMQGGEFEVLYPNPDFMKQSIKVWCSKWYRTFAEWYKGTQASWNPIYNYDRMEETRDESRRKSDSKTTADYSDKRTADLTDKRTVSLEDERTADLKEKRTADLTDKRTAALQDETTTENKENVSNIGTDTTSQPVKSTTEHLVSAYDSSSYQASSKDIIDNGTSTVAHNNDVENKKEGTEVNKHTGYDIMDHTGTDETATSGTDTMKHSGFDTLDTTGTDENVRKGTLADTSGSEQNTNIHTAHMYGNIGVTTSAAMLKEFYDIALWNLYEHISDVFISELLIPVY